MKNKGNLTLKILAGSLATAGLWFSYPADQLAAQTPAADGTPPAAAAGSQSTPADPDYTITISQKVPVNIFEFEDLKVAVDAYQVKRGDSLVKLLRARGFLNSSSSKAEEAKLLRLVKSLNPEVKDLSTIVPGQMINVPSLLKEAAEDLTDTPPQATAPVQPRSLPTATVKEYERPQPGYQKPAQVTTIVRDPKGVEPSVPVRTAGVQEADKSLESPAAGEGPASSAPATETPPTVSTEGTGQAPGVPTPADLDFPSGNTGVLAMEPESKVVYRTVKVRRGDSLERLLRREGMHRDLIYGHLLKVTLELNPEINNPDLILAGTEIKIPAAGDYLTAMAGVNPQEVRAAAKAVHERRRTAGGGAGSQSNRAAVLELPDEAVLTARNTLGLIFTRLGQKVDSRGTALIPAGEGGVELDTASFPVVELAGGRRLVLDPGSRLSSAAVRNLRQLEPPYQVFRTGRRESLERALGRLWSLCGFFRVYTNDRTYEGGGDIRLKISADWMVWATQEAWNSGQPLVINRAKSPEVRTSPAWTAFLEAHGIKVLDVHRNQLLPAPEARPGPPDLAVVNLNDQHPTMLAAELVRQLGVEPRVGVQVDLARQPGQTVAPNLTAPVLWEDGATRVVMEFGELPPEAIQTLRRNDYRVISSPRETEAVIDGVLSGFNLKAQNSLVLKAPAGGPKMSLSIKGKLVTRGDHRYLITQTPLPAGLAGLVEPGLKVLKY